MRPFLRRALQGAGAAALAVVLGSTPAAAGVGTRLANGAGATSGLCMGVTNGGTGTLVEMETCTLNAHHGWSFDDEGPWFRIKSQDADAAGRCLTSHGEGVRVTMDRCVTDPNHSVYDRQLWAHVWSSSSTSGWYQYQNKWSNGTRQCLDVRDNGRSRVVQIWLCGPESPPGLKGNQLWKYY